MKTEEIEGVKIVLDNLLLQTAILSTKLNVLTSMVVGVYGETIPSDHYSAIYTTFVNTLEKEMKESFKRLDGVLYDSGMFLFRHEVEELLSIQSLKSNPGYTDDSENKNKYR